MLGLRLLATIAGLGTISPSSDIVRFVQGGVVQTFRRPLRVYSMGPKTKLLCDRLRDTSTLLRSAGESHWAKWLETSLHRIENGDFSGVEHLLGAFGGMGSFNDLVLAAANGHVVNDGNWREFNEQLDDLRGQLYTLAQDVRRNASIGD